VNFPANRPSKKTPFKVYRREEDMDSEKDFSKQATLIAGETGDMEFYSFNKDLLDVPEENYTCQ
jgi:DNA-directed RNA polymerase I subunit RPA49